MKIVMTAMSAGPNGVREIGKVYDVPAKEAKDLIDGGYAEAVKEAPKKETATSKGAAKKETATGDGQETE